MDEFRPQLDGNRRLRIFRDYLPSQYASADAIAGVENRHAPAGLRQPPPVGSSGTVTPNASITFFLGGLYWWSLESYGDRTVAAGAAAA
jgi:hypothetical protein